MRRENIKFLYKYIRWKPQLLEKFHAKSDKKQKIFFCTPVSNFQKMSTLNICDGAKQIYPKKQKKILRKDSVRISEAVDGRWERGIL